MRKIANKVINRLHTLYCKALGTAIGKKSIIAFSVFISKHAGVSLGDSSVIYGRCILHLGKTGCVSVGDNSHLAPYSYILTEKNRLVIGNDVAIGPFCSFFCVSNSSAGSSRLFRENYKYGDIRIGNNVFVGAHCVFLPGVVVNDNVVISANSVVQQTLENGWIYGGNPAVKLKEIET